MEENTSTNILSNLPVRIRNIISNSVAALLIAMLAMLIFIGYKSITARYTGVSESRNLFQKEIQDLQNPANSAWKLAAAFALGTLLSFIPLPMLDSMLVGMVLIRFKQVNRGALLMARLLWNDLVVFPLYGPGYRLGSMIMVPLLDAKSEMAGMGTAVEPVLSLTLGGLILAFGLTVAGYVMFLLGIQMWRLVSGER